MRRFFVPPENFYDRQIKLSLDESKHLRDVLRLRGGDEVCVFDGKENEFLCVVAETGGKRDASTLRVLHKLSPASPESELNLTLGVALLKGEKFDLVVQKAVELGVATLVPLLTKRGDSKNVRLERWQKISIEAAKQSGRARLMKISETLDFEVFIEKAEGSKILFSERNGESFSVIKPDKIITAVVGSEGGWEDSEIESARSNNFQIITLGGRILRAETAAIAIAAVLQNRFGDMN